jgi:hypothetical protein
MELETGRRHKEQADGVADSSGLTMTAPPPPLCPGRSASGPGRSTSAAPPRLLHLKRDDAALLMEEADMSSCRMQEARDVL